MTVLYVWGYRFGSFAGRRAMALFFLMVLAFPLVALTLAVVAPSLGHSVFSAFCHQNPERSFGALPLCSRCLGLYLGLGLAGLLAPVFPFRFSRRFLAAGVAASLGLIAWNLFSPGFDGNYARLILGLSVGAGFALLVKSILK
jgi:uncharacterized membrane protein